MPTRRYWCLPEGLGAGAVVLDAAGHEEPPLGDTRGVVGPGRGHRSDLAPLVHGRVIALDGCRHAAVPQSAACIDRDNRTC